VRRLASNYPTRDIGHQIDTEAIKRHGFQDQRILVAKLDDPRLDEFERQVLKNVGAKLYGQRA
jgi:hypothetical protein